MSLLHRRRRVAAPAVLVSALLAAVTASGAGPTSAAPEHQRISPHGDRQLRAVVALVGTTGVTAPGVRVVGVLPGVRSEVVAGSAAALAGLARDPRVLGLRPDAKVVLAGHDTGTGPAVAAWQRIGGRAGRTGAGRGVTVALVDTGVSDTAALSRAGGRLVDVVDTSPLIDLQQPLTSGTFADGFGHGTFLASLIAGGPAPGSGGRPVGVAPGATVDVVKVASADGTTSLAAVLAGLNWVALHADSVQVANIALGLPTGGQWGADPLNLATQWVRDAGVLVVAAAGNVPGQVADPGFDPRALTVGAADATKGRVRIAPFSGSARIAGVDKPDVVASGVGVLGLLPPGSLIAQQYPEARQPSGLWRGSGTSEATAVTSGVAALYFADHPRATPRQAKSALRVAARPVRGKGIGARAGEGLVHAAEQADRAAARDAGEGSFDAVAWTTSPWAQVSMTAASWAAASWARAASWAGSAWQGNQWASGWWEAASWARAASWASSSWARAASWAAASWAAGSWAAGSWAAASWARTPGRDSTGPGAGHDGARS
ncbi:MAG: S8 family serine peptidase [Frankiaceae bacterium]